MSEFRFKIEERRDIEDGFYEAELEKLERLDLQNGIVIRWYFKLANGAKVTGLTALRKTTLGNMYKWFKALGGQIQNGEVDLTTVIGNKCIVEIKNRQRRTGNFPTVVNVLPAKAKK